MGFFTWLREIVVKDTDGYDDDGYDGEGYDKEGYNEYGRDRAGYDKGGFDGYQNHKETRTKYDLKGYDSSGYNKNGWTREGMYIEEADYIPVSMYTEPYDYKAGRSPRNH